MTIPHPTGSEEFAAQLMRLGFPAPWRLTEFADAVLDANGHFVLAPGRWETTREDMLALASWIICAVNTLAGYRAEIEDA